MYEPTSQDILDRLILEGLDLPYFLTYQAIWFMNKKIKIVKEIDKLLASIDRQPSGYNLIINSLSIEQLKYYLELTKDEVYYYNVWEPF